MWTIIVLSRCYVQTRDKFCFMKLQLNTADNVFSDNLSWLPTIHHSCQRSIVAANHHSWLPTIDRGYHDTSRLPTVHRGCRNPSWLPTVRHGCTVQALRYSQYLACLIVLLFSQHSDSKRLRWEIIASIANPGTQRCHSLTPPTPI